MRITLSRRSKEPKEFNHLIGIVAVSCTDQRFGSLERLYNVMILNDNFSAGNLRCYRSRSLCVGVLPVLSASIRVKN